MFQKYEEWKENLPDFSWIADLMPPPEKIDSYRERLMDLKNNINLPETGWVKKNIDVFAGKLDNWKEFLKANNISDFNDGDPTTELAEGIYFIISRYFQIKIVFIIFFCNFLKF